RLILSWCCWIEAGLSGRSSRVATAEARMACFWGILVVLILGLCLRLRLCLCELVLRLHLGLLIHHVIPRRKLLLLGLLIISGARSLGGWRLWKVGEAACSIFWSVRGRSLLLGLRRSRRRLGCILLLPLPGGGGTRGSVARGGPVIGVPRF